MTKKLTTADFIKKAKSVHGDKYDYSTCEYKTAHGHIKFRCKEHGLEIEIKAYKHLQGQMGCADCASKGKQRLRMTTQEFIKKATEIHGDAYDYHQFEYAGARKLSKIYCNNHNGYFYQKPVDHLQGRGCSECSNKLSKKDFIERLSEVNNGLYDLSHVNYLTMRDKITMICKEHGAFDIRSDAALKGSGCQQCSLLKRGDDQRFSHDQFVESAKLIHGDIYTYMSEYIGSKGDMTIICKDHGEFTQTAESHIKGSGCPYCSHRISKQELELVAYIESIYDGEIVMSGQYFKNTKQEIDIYLPELKIGFEFNGVWTHNERFKDQTYHYNKTKMANQAGIRLIHIWEDDWRDNRVKQESFIKRLIVKGDNRVVYARKTEIVNVDKDVVKQFMNDYHIQGSSRSTIDVGLTFNGDLVCVASFANRNSRGFELVRFATSGDLVIGGLGKLSKFVAKTEQTPIFTFCDNSRFNGQSYVENGYIATEKLRQDYMYVVNGKREHKFGYRKNLIKKKYPDVVEGTEHEMMQHLKIYRIYDAGKTKYEFTIV